MALGSAGSSGWGRGWTWFCLLVLLLAGPMVGCGGDETAARLAEARQTVERALDRWKQGGKPAQLMTATPPVEFFDDDWNRSAKLLAFEIVNTYLDSDDAPRCAVKLSIQHGTRPAQEVRATYQLVQKDQRVVVARDPFS